MRPERIRRATLGATVLLAVVVAYAGLPAIMAWLWSPPGWGKFLLGALVFAALFVALVWGREDDGGGRYVTPVPPSPEVEAHSLARARVGNEEESG